MTKLYLYSIFHGNLNYSSIPPESYDEIIDSCYWPILDILKDYKFKTGIEFPIATLEKIENTDPLFIEELRKAISNKNCEIICSGNEQVVFPLVPEDVNRVNISTGKDEIEKLFSIQCNTAYINEQLFSSGLVPIYLDAKIKNIITIHEWASKFSDFHEYEKFLPKKIGSKNGDLSIIWNSYITYQKFQRYINGEIEKEEYLKYILKHKQGVDSCFPFYGSDMEIFGYKNPVLGLKGDGKEIQRFRQIMDEIERKSDLEFILPSQVIERFPPKDRIKMNSAKFAILGKKQDKFIVTRWATCGRDNSNSNTTCYNLLKKIRILQGIQDDNKDSTYILKLINCWASDFRTHTTEAKYLHFNDISRSLNKEIDQEIFSWNEKVSFEESSDLILFNPNETDWENIPFELRLHFRPRKIKGKFEIIIDGKLISSQIEETKYYKDGSLRSAVVVFEPSIRKKTIATITLRPTSKKIISKSRQADSIKTPTVELSILKRKGGSISDVIFTKISKSPLIGFLEHGTFSDTKFSADFYSGHTIAFDRNGNKFTDLTNVEAISEEGDFPIRKKLVCNMELPFGHLTKIYYAYQKQARLDIRYIFNFKEFRPASFRVGILTTKPDAFDKKSLNYSTHNGGRLESFTLDKESITQDESSDPRLTNQGCLGSTEGILDFGDKNIGITMFSDKSLWYSVPMINYHNVGKSFFYRISNSVSELDDTTMTWWKGRKEISFSLLGREKSPENNLKTTKMMFLGLVCFTRNPDIKVIK